MFGVTDLLIYFALFAGCTFLEMDPLIFLVALVSRLILFRYVFSLRKVIREKYGISGGDDCSVSLCCLPCTLAQMARQFMDYDINKKHKNVGCDPFFDPESLVHTQENQGHHSIAW